MYVSRLDRPWSETPFLTQGFYVKSADEIQKLKESSRFAYVMLPDEEYTLQSAHKKPLNLATINDLLGAADTKSLVSSIALLDELPGAEKAHAAMEQGAGQIWDALRQGSTLGMGDIRADARIMVDSIARNPDAYMWLCAAKEYQSTTYQRAVKVSALLTLFGKQLGLGNDDLQILAVGGLCLDVGNIRLPEDLLNKETRLTDDEWESMKTHVRHGMQLLKKYSDADEKLLWMVATHHERYDGSGYLAGLAGDHIPLFGQMAGIVDTYLASIEPKPYAPAMTSDDSIETLFRQRGHHFKAPLVDQFIAAIGLYPTGSLVELSSGEIAAVIAQNREQRLRPQVALVRDAQKQPSPGYSWVDLAEQKKVGDGTTLSVAKGQRAGQYPIALDRVLGSLTSHVEDKPVITRDDVRDRIKEKPVTTHDDVRDRIKENPPAPDVIRDLEREIDQLVPVTVSDIKRLAPSKPKRKKKKSSKIVAVAAAALAGIAIAGAYIGHQHQQLQSLTQQLEESRQAVAQKSEKARLVAEAEAKRRAVADLKSKQTRLAAEAEARRKQVEAELKAVVEARRNAKREAEVSATAQRQAEREAELAAAAASRRQAERDAQNAAAVEAQRQAKSMPEVAATDAPRQQVGWEFKAASAAESALRVAPQPELIAAAEVEPHTGPQAESAANGATRHAAAAAEIDAAVDSRQLDASQPVPVAAAEPHGQAQQGTESPAAAEAKRQAERNTKLAAAAEARRRAEREALQPGKVFRDQFEDGSEGPEMVVIPAGRFRMGNLHGGGDADEKPVHTVTFDEPFAIGRYEVTFAEFDRYARVAGRRLPSSNGWDRGRIPVVNVSWQDAVAYARWLSQQTGHSYRLPTEAEWEYAARAGTEYKYAWGNDMEGNRANCSGCRSAWDGRQPAPVGSFEPNRFALYDTAGNVWEWVQDCWHRYNGRENSRASGWSELSGKSCSRRMRRGGSWNDEPDYVRVANRGRGAPDYRSVNLGFRLARDID